ncbi:UDP-glucose 4-epimerase GalE [Microvirga puerhi]|uniref:UDP-glucose 4-epimerase n=1 Tax=Microvirga puerhi TaxID=2876078 RepID=A0ABS7VU53_9HYPH|nr:UDP-glucose 4-epimerase GalE [Microvirga puerhi]MBZ6079113.1 UDP-glucose 4-epimerase GalE [Microvirga puerhi]
MSSRRVFVTGGAGFIGSHTCKVLSAHGFEPVTYDNLVTGHRDAVRWGPLVEGDILDTAFLASALIEYRPLAILHFAAFAYVGESVSDPAKYYRNNVSGMLSLLEACRATNLKQIIFSSSCATYGIPDRLPINEQASQRPINPYGRSKLIAEQMLEDHAAAYGIGYVALRYFNACGSDPDGQLGEWHSPETHLIPCALLAAGGNREHLSVFGDDYDTTDGTCVRDYIHVTDLARAHVMALQHLLDGGKNLALNLGTGRGLSILDVLNSIRRVTNRTVPIRIEPRRAGDPPALFADPTLARICLGFSPELSEIDTIVRTAAPFFGLRV